MQKKLVLASLLIVGLSLNSLAFTEAARETVYELKLQGLTWNHSTITISIVPALDEPWWNALYLNSTLDAIDEWNGAISDYASNHSQSHNLSRLSLSPQIYDSLNCSSDVCISWIEDFGNGSVDGGLTRTEEGVSYTILNNSVTLAAKDSYGESLDELDMHAVALHELGHCLGLGHANFSRDTMYYEYVLHSSERALSTLDVYGVDMVFRWLSYSKHYDLTYFSVPSGSVALPSDVEYQYLPIPEKDVISDSTFPEIIVLVLVTVSTIAAFALIYSRYRSRSVLKQTSH